MRIGLVIYGDLGTVSGGYLYDRKLVEYLRVRGDEVELVSLPWRGYARHLGDNFSSQWRRRLETLRVDILLQDELNHPSLAYLNPHIRQHLHCPLISIVHHLRSSEQHPAWMLPLYRAVERSYLRNVDGFIFNSQTTRRSVEAMLSDLPRSVVAYPAGDRFQKDVSLAQLAARAKQAGPIQVLFVGNLIPRKNLGLVLNALAQMEPSAWNLTVVGNPTVDPDYSREMHALAARLGIEPRVNFLGTVSDADLSIHLRRSHVLAVPSSYEGFGIVYLEGFQHGLPALASDQGAAGEIVTPGVTGWLVGTQQVDAAAAALQQVAEDRELLCQMGAAAQRRFQDFPTWEQTGQSIYHFLRTWI
jgi:glycosyltransferase involved in cell wall biosynthesis